MTIKHLFPVSKPTLDLNFAAELALDPSITFTRSSIGTYFAANGILQTAADDEARFDHDGGTGESLGLLIEESRTNLVQYSEDFSQTSQWGFNNSSYSLDSAAVAPDGSTGVYKIVEDAVPGSHLVRCLPVNQCTAGTTYTYSMFCKAAERTQIMMHFDGEGGSNTYFDLSSGEITSGTVGTIRDAGGGWYHCSITFNPVSNSEPKFYTSVNGSISTSGDGVSGVYIWGGQLEANAGFATSYIPTAGSAVTRAADLCTIEGDNFSSWYQPLENSMFTKVSTFDTGTNSKAALVTFDSTQGSSINSTVEGGRAFYYVGDTNYIQVTTRTPEKVRRVVPNDPGYNPLGQFNSIAQGYAGTDSGCAVNGSDPGYTNSASLNPGTVDSMWIGRNENVSMWLNGHIARIAYYPRRLSDEQLEALTA